MKTLLTLFLAFASLATAQTYTLLTTTLLGAVGANDESVSLASTTGLVLGNYIYADRELMQISGTPSGTSARVYRGVNGTQATAHASAATAYAGDTSLFYTNGPSGSCAAPSTVTTVNMLNGGTSTCVSGTWTVAVGSAIAESGVTNLVSDLALKAPLLNPLFISTTAPQVVTGYDTSNKLSASTDSAGITTLQPVGTTPRVRVYNASAASGTLNDTALMIERDDTAGSPQQLLIRGATTNAFQMQLGYNTSLNYGSINVIQQGVAFKNLVLLDGGANVLIANKTDTGSGAQLQVNGPGLQLVGGTQPTCDATHRGEFNVVGATHTGGVKDSIVACAADAANAYAWRTIY